MAEVKYTLQYLPTFYTDLEEHVMYIVVIPNGRNKKIMEVRRILHGLQDRDKAL